MLVVQGKKAVGDARLAASFVFARGVWMSERIVARAHRGRPMCPLMAVDGEGTRGYDDGMTQLELGPNVAAAMRDGAVTRRDARGLMPLADARTLVRAATEFRKGDGAMVDGTFVLPSDRLWAALMSLDDAEEFVREATRIRWFFHPRGRDNVAPYERYGEGILPWLEAHVQRGRLVNIPWCVDPCFAALESPRGFDVLWTVRTAVEGTGDEWPGPFASDNAGDADQRHGVALHAPAPAAAADSANGLVIGWIYAHPDVGFAKLAALAAAADPRAALMLKSLAQIGPQEVFGHVVAAIGEARADALFTQVGAPKEIDAAAILVVLDGAAMNDAIGAWPELCCDDADRAYHGMRVVAARARTGDGWGILFERIEGSWEDGAVVQAYAYGSAVGQGALADGSRPLGFYVDGDEEEEDEDDGDDEDGDNDSDEDVDLSLDGVEVTGPAGPLVLSEAMVKRHDLRPGATTAPEADPRFALLLHAYMAQHPRSFFGDPREAAELLELGDDFDVVVVSEAFEHVVGPTDRGAPHDAAWAKRPSDSKVFQSLTEALVARDGARFRSGASNLDWRLHARADWPEDNEDDDSEDGRRR